MSAVPWFEGSYEEIAARVRAGVGSAAGARVQELWSQAKNVVDDCDALIISTVRSNAGAWAGRAADEFHSALEPLSAWVVDASADATTMVNAVVAQGGHADEFRRLLPDPPPTGGRLDWVQVRHTVATDDARRLALDYARHTADNQNALSLWSAPPAVTVDVPRPAAAGATVRKARTAGTGVVAAGVPAGAAATGARPGPVFPVPTVAAAISRAAGVGPAGDSAASAGAGGSPGPAGGGKAAGGAGDLPAAGLAIPTAAGLGGSGGLIPSARATPSGAAPTTANGAGDAAGTAANGTGGATWTAANGAGGVARAAENGASYSPWTAADDEGGAARSTGNGGGRAAWSTGNGSGGAAELPQGGAPDLGRVGRVPTSGGIDAEPFSAPDGTTGPYGGQSSPGAGAERIPGVTRAVPGHGGVDGLAPGVGGRGSFAATPRPGPSGESGVSGWRDLVAGQAPADATSNAAATERAGGFYPPMTGGAAGGQESTHRRPEYLLDDAGAFVDHRWIGPAVITPDDPLPGGPGS